MVHWLASVVPDSEKACTKYYQLVHTEDLASSKTVVTNLLVIL